MVSNIIRKILFHLGRYIFLGLGMFLGDVLISKSWPLILSSSLLSNPTMPLVFGLAPYLLLIISIIILWRFFACFDKIPDMEKNKFYKWVYTNYIGETFIMGIVMAVAVRSAAQIILRLSN